MAGLCTLRRTISRVTMSRVAFGFFQPLFFAQIRPTFQIEPLGTGRSKLENSPGFMISFHAFKALILHGLTHALVFGMVIRLPKVPRANCVFFPPFPPYVARARFLLRGRLGVSHASA